MRPVLAAVLVAVCVTALAPSDAAAQAPPMRPGLWEVSVQTEMVGMPMAMPMITASHCVTPDMLESPDGVFQGGPLGGPMQMDQTQSDCAMEEYNVSGQTVTWTMSCTQPQAVTVTGEMTFTDDRYTGTMQSTTPAGPMTMNLDARRVGACE